MSFERHLGRGKDLDSPGQSPSKFEVSLTLDVPYFEANAAPGSPRKTLSNHVGSVEVPVKSKPSRPEYVSYSSRDSYLKGRLPV